VHLADRWNAERDRLIKEYAESKRWSGPHVDEVELEGVEIIQDRVIDSSRWMLFNEQILTDGTEFVRIRFSTGATEMQDSPSLSEETVTAEKVIAKEVTTTIYVKE